MRIKNKQILCVQFSKLITNSIGYRLQTYI